MDTLTGRPELLRQANLSLIRRAIRRKGTATRGEIAEETKISSTTVRTLLTQMMTAGEIESVGFDKSGGGRKAERYRFRADQYYGAAFCIGDGQIDVLLVDACGEICETARLETADREFEQVITAYLDELLPHREIKSVGIGVPGVVDGGSYWKKYRNSDELYREDLGERIIRRYGIPVVMENDMNATAIGFGRCYGKEFPEENPEDMNLAYLHFDKGCIGAGFIAGGRIVRGYNNFAGELGLIPMDDGRTMDQWLSDPVQDAKYIDLVTKIICWICAILNPQYIALGGPSLREDCVGPVGDGLFALLPRHMSPQILYSPDVQQDYHDGMAYLTVSGMFDEIQLRRE